MTKLKLKINVEYCFETEAVDVLLYIYERIAGAQQPDWPGLKESEILNVEKIVSHDDQSDEFNRKLSYKQWND